MKKLLKKLLRDRRGISMTEVIVAMALVTIVTGAAISVVMASIKFDAKYNNETTALSYCESVVDCVRFADDEIELKTALSSLGLTVEEDFSGGFKLIDESFTIYVYEHSEDENKIVITAENTNREEIYGTVYEKN